ncbi:hypothetical protein [Micromonospora sediminicola]|uniref:hypothetical protein n=1 Tax=Micromonospora sediminicola TaxID=946078 RepID=UPI0037B92B3A
MSAEQETTLMLFKPDVYEKGLQDHIEADVQRLDLRIVERFQISFPPEGVFHLWPRIYGRRWTASLAATLPRRPLDVFVLKGVEAIERLIVFKDTLRESSAQVNSYRNLLHSPDSSGAFQREYAYLRTLRVDAR